MRSIAMVMDGYVYGVLLMKDKEIKRAWIDPESKPGVYQKMEFRDTPEKVMAAVDKVLAVRYIPEVDPKNYQFIFYETDQFEVSRI